ncbi:hypothetical protein QFC22_003223 [Naganishia vaughanmartiniae]|uniref:Uncharacterized protein n=1 Tax=Naganishia vaughanmartiniae TaxID=1424756 RepID=A0ACC2X632_9TREE|nr:hypothetical protein QFC22_003223 [Naganishia vaughanmartiniae]
MPSHYPINSSSLGFTSSISSTAVGSSAFAGGSSSYPRTATGAYANGNGASYSGKDYEALGKLQDVVWSDEEEEPECPLCMEELDPSDVHFKPCVCGYQICRFCHHHILTDSNGLCPACRRSYREQKIEFRPVDPEEMKRLQQAKQLKQKVNKQLETLGRLQHRDVRILVKNMIYVTGMKMMGEGTEEFLSILRSNDYFGQYGKIAKVFLRKGPSTSDPTSGSIESSTDSDELGIYITYLRREDASRAIATLDGVSAPGNPGKTLKVTYGSTKYCLSWLRGVKCDEGSACLGAHDWAAENDTFTRKDMTTLQQAIKNSGTNMDIMMQREQRSTPKPTSGGSSSKANKAMEEPLDSSALPRTAHWAARPTPAPSPSPLLSNATVVASSIPPKRPKAKVLSLSSNGAKPTLTTLGSSSKLRATTATIPSIAEDARSSVTVASSDTRNTRSSRSPSATFEEPAVAEVSTRKAAKAERLSPAPTSVSARSSEDHVSSTRSPSPLSDVSQHIPKVEENATTVDILETMTTAHDDADMVEMELPSQPHDPQAVAEPSVVSGPPPGLSMTSHDAYVPPPPSNVPVVLLPQSSTPEQYQPSVQAQAMMDDVMSRREGLTPIFTVQSPYPDFEDLLAPFADGEFEYKLDVEMIMEVDDTPLAMTGVEDLLSLSNKMDGIRKTASYQGPFDPFVENQLYDAVQAMSGATAGGDAKSSRFSFAKGTGYEGQPKLSLASSADYPVVASSSRSPSEKHAMPPSLNYQYFLNKESSVPFTPPSRSALPYSLGVSSPGENNAIPRTRTPTLAPPPPPGLGMPQQQTLQHPSFPVYQNMNGGPQQIRSRDQQTLNQQQHQLLTSLRDFHQPYAPERRTASPSLVQALRGGNVNAQYNGRDMYTPSGESFPIQDPAVMAVRSGYIPGDAQQHQQRQSSHRNQLLEQFSLPFDPSSPYPQQQQLAGYPNGAHQSNQSQSAQQDMTLNARSLQLMHDQMNAMSANGSNGRATPRSASRQAMSGRVY